MKYAAYFVIITFLVIIILPTAIVKGCNVIYKPEEKLIPKNLSLMYITIIRTKLWKWS